MTTSVTTRIHNTIKFKAIYIVILQNFEYKVFDKDEEITLKSV